MFYVLDTLWDSGSYTVLLHTTHKMWSQMEDDEVCSLLLWVPCVLSSELPVCGHHIRVSCSASAKTLVLNFPQMYLSIPQTLLTVHKLPPMLQEHPHATFIPLPSGLRCSSPLAKPILHGFHLLHLPPEMNVTVTCPQMHHLCPFPLSSPSSDSTEVDIYYVHLRVSKWPLVLARVGLLKNHAHSSTLWHLCQAWSSWKRRGKGW